MAECFDNQNYEKAIEDFSKAIEQDSDNGIYYYQRGQIYLQDKDYEKAVADFKTTINLDPSFRQGICQRGLESFFNFLSEEVEKIVERC